LDIISYQIPWRLLEKMIQRFKEGAAYSCFLLSEKGLEYPKNGEGIFLCIFFIDDNPTAFWRTFKKVKAQMI